MDFKAALQAEIETKKRQLAKVSNSNSKSSADKITSVKVSDLEKQRQEEYLEKQNSLNEHRNVKKMIII